MVLALLGLFFSVSLAGSGGNDCGLMGMGTTFGETAPHMADASTPRTSREAGADMRMDRMDCAMQCALGCFVFISPATLAEGPVFRATIATPAPDFVIARTPDILIPPPRAIA